MAQTIRAITTENVWSSATPNVNAGEQEQPDDIDKVPVPGCSFETEMVIILKVAANRPYQADEQEDRTDDHMETVEAGGHEEGRRINACLLYTSDAADDA